MQKNPESLLYGLSLTQDGLTTSNCNIMAGGYVKIGQLVVVNMRIKQTGGANFYVRGFPTYTSIANRVAASIVDTDTNAPIGTGIATNGELGYASSTTHQYIISATYIAD